MKDKHKNLPPAGQHPAPPPPPPEKHHKHERRRRRGPSFGFIFFLILVLAIAALVVLWKLGYIHIGKDSGQGAGDGGSSSVVSADSSDTSEEESTLIEIRVSKEKIYFDGEELADAEALKAKITEIGDKKAYDFIDDSAIKATYDEVKAVLNELEKALDIKVNYDVTGGNLSAGS